MATPLPFRNILLRRPVFEPLFFLKILLWLLFLSQMAWGFCFAILHGSGDYAVALALSHYDDHPSPENKSKLEHQRQLRAADHQRHSIIFGSIFTANLVCLAFVWEEVTKKEPLYSKTRFLSGVCILLITTQIIALLLLLHPPFVESKAWAYAITNKGGNPTAENQLEFEIEREFRATQANLTTLKLGIIFISNLAVLVLIYRQIKPAIPRRNPS